jgi:ribosomal protein L20A (L18A)
LKAEIDKTIADSKRIEQDSKVIKDQVKSLENQLRVLDEAYSALANENKLKRQRIQLKD